MSIKVTLPTAFTRHTDGRKQFDSAAQNLPGLLIDIMESQGTAGRQIDPAETDLGWHALSLILAALRAQGVRAAIVLDEVRTALYVPPVGEPAALVEFAKDAADARAAETKLCNAQIRCSNLAE